MFRLNYKQGTKLTFQSLSLAVYYISDDKNIKNSIASFEKKFRVKISELQMKNILAKKNKQISISNLKGKPEHLTLHKFKIDEKFTVDYFRNHLAGFIKEIKYDEVQSLPLFIPDYEIVKKYFSPPGSLPTQGRASAEGRPDRA